MAIHPNKPNNYIQLEMSNPCQIIAIEALFLFAPLHSRYPKNAYTSLIEE